jgi:hypothetical protein
VIGNGVSGNGMEYRPSHDSPRLRFPIRSTTRRDRVAPQQLADVKSCCTSDGSVASALPQFVSPVRNSMAKAPALRGAPAMTVDVHASLEEIDPCAASVQDFEDRDPAHPAAANEVAAMPPLPKKSASNGSPALLTPLRTKAYAALQRTPFRRTKATEFAPPMRKATPARKRLSELLDKKAAAVVSQTFDAASAACAKMDGK